MSNWSGILGALGDAFIGYGKDRDRMFEQDRTRALDQQNADDRAFQHQHMLTQEQQAADLHGAQMKNYEAEAAMRAQRTRQEAVLQSPEFQARYQQALQYDDPEAKAWVTRAVAGHPNVAQILAPMNRPDKEQYVDSRGGSVNFDTHTFTPITGLPALQEKPADKRALTAQELQQKRQDLTDARAGFTTAKSSLDEARRDIPRPSKVQQQIYGARPDGKTGMVDNPAYGRAIADSTDYERKIMDPARTNLNNAQSSIQRLISGGEDAPDGAPGKPSAQQRALQLRTEGKTKQQALAIMQSEGYQVHDSSPRP